MNETSTHPIRHHVCDECGAPAVSAAAEVLEVEHWSTGHMEYEPVGVNYGCSEHIVKRRTVGRTATL